MGIKQILAQCKNMAITDVFSYDFRIYFYHSAQTHSPIPFKFGTKNMSSGDLADFGTMPNEIIMDVFLMILA